MIKIGALAHNYGKDTPDQLFERIHKDGFEAVQLAIKKAIAGIDKSEDITSSTVSSISDAQRKHGIHIAVLGVYIEPSLKDNVKREANVEEFVRSIPIAKALHADCIGTETTPRKLQPKVTRAEALDALYRSLWEIMPAAEENQVVVGMEPVYTHTVNTPELAAEVMKTVASPWFKIIFDPVNLISPETFRTQEDVWERAFEAYGSNMVAVHMKGAALNDENQVISTSYPESALNYKFLFDHLKQLKHDFCIMREEIQPEYGHQDCRFLKSFL